MVLKLEHKFEDEENDLDSANDREAGEEAHGAPDSRKLVHKICLLILKRRGEI